MSNQNLHRSHKQRNTPRWRAAFSGILCGALAAVVLPVCCLPQAATEIPVSQSEPSQSASIYDPDPNHLWNRLFVLFYHQRVSYGTTYAGDKTVTYWVGPDVVDPPLGYLSRFLLDDEPFVKCNSVLDEFLNHQGAELIHDPLKRAMFQHDLWGVFDVLVQADFTNPEQPLLTPSQEQHRIVLERKIGQVIHSLALSRVEINNLPDSYAAAVHSGAFSDRLESKSYNFLPPDLFATNSAWFEVNSGNPHLQHSLIAGGRSVFRAFVKSPAGFTNVLGDYIRDMEGWRREYGAWAQLQQTNRGTASQAEPQRPSTLLPVGTQFLLLREMICLDEKLQMVPTHVVESVQFRSIYKKGTFDQKIGREADLNRVLLFQAKQGGLRPISAGEPVFAGYASLGHLELDAKGNAPIQVLFPQNCAGCHITGGDLFSNAQTCSKPMRSTSIEYLSGWKKEKGKLDQLREFILSPTSNEK